MSNSSYSHSDRSNSTFCEIQESRTFPSVFCSNTLIKENSKENFEEDGEKIEVIELLKDIDRPLRVCAIYLSIESAKRPVISDLYSALQKSKICVDKNCRIYWQSKINHISPVFNHITLSLFLQMASKSNRKLFVVRDLEADKEKPNDTIYNFELHLYNVDKADEELILGLVAHTNNIFDKTEEAANSSALLISRYDHMPYERARTAGKDKSTASSKRDKTPESKKESKKIPKKGKK